MSAAACVDHGGPHDVRREAPPLVVLHDLVGELVERADQHVWRADHVGGTSRPRTPFGDPGRGLHPGAR